MRETKGEIVVVITLRVLLWQQESRWCTIEEISWVSSGSDSESSPWCHATFQVFLYIFVACNLLYEVYSRQKSVAAKIKSTEFSMSCSRDKNSFLLNDCQSRDHDDDAGVCCCLKSLYLEVLVFITLTLHRRQSLVVVYASSRKTT